MSKELSELLENVTCPVCLEIPRKGGFFQCPNGHLICEGDFGKMKGNSAKLCPQCRDPYILSGGGDRKRGARKLPPRSQLANSLLDMLDLPCRYKGHGCQFKGKDSSLVNHEKKCRFMPLQCVTMTNCAASVPLSLMEAHLKTAHQKVQFWDANQIKLCYLVDEGEVVGDVQHYPGHVMNFDGRGFYLGFCKIGEVWRIWASFLGAEQSAENYQVTINTHNPKRKGHQLRFTGPVNPPSTFGFDKMTSKVCGLVVPSNVAERNLINMHAQWNKRVMSVQFQINKLVQPQ